MNPQPYWPDGHKPDKITDMSCGFFDGDGIAHYKPLHSECIAMPDENGCWYWVSDEVGFIHEMAARYAFKHNEPIGG